MFEELFSLKNQVAVMTGGGSGIGLAMAGILTDAGARLAIVDLNREAADRAAKGLRDRGGDSMAFYADVSKLDQVEAMAEAVEKQMGPIGILVNCAGINIRKKAIDFELHEWQKILEVNITGTYLPSRVIGKRMIERRRGRVINISSVASAIGLVDRAPYCSSKGGVTQLTKVLAIEWAPYGITVNAIGPGYMNTPLIADLVKDPAWQASVKAQVPIGRVGETKDLAGILLVLCSNAGSYITGQTIYIDGGWTIW